MFSQKELKKITIWQGDITSLDVDAIVNAANQTLLGGGGVDGAIHRASGPNLLKECRKLNGCKTGEAKLTKGYDLPAKYVIHTVGPIYKQAGDSAARLLADCYRNSLLLAVKHNITSLAFPAISCGIYGYPVADACRIAVDESLNFLKEHQQIQKIIFALFSAANKQIYDDYTASI